MTSSYKDSSLKVFSLNSNPELANEIATHIGTNLGKCTVSKFSDGEVQINLEESVRGCDVYVVQSTCAPVNQHIMELLIMIDALKRASAKSINIVMPYYGYARQDRKARSREPIAAKLVADLIEKAGANRVITLDLHAPQIQGFFDIPIDHLQGVPILSSYFEQKNLDDVIVVSPDHGGVTRARKMADRLKAPIGIIDKRRPKPNVAEIMNIIGNIEGKTAILIDDIIDTAGTITLAANALIENGAKEVYACCTHPVLSGPAIERIDNSKIKELVITDSIPLPDEKFSTKITALSVAPLIGEAIIRVHEMQSVSILFD
ncbi:ribose-phosphate diphosphokinase [Oceanobacillus iheyensis]|uniref:Ribose-phosphate pyrophosphokinase n=1 Tax=Oceanobacillus iheyensis (strain DSM 14371 / CIP 107618 / JCM 11309 / KCTC 3954 / HTE831) TaxID=221109 RepID=KPRS_OCEIH|nr:ribose-phosphate diphosphokinase [Oceanobacillus iheyensis]Q8EU34.1 RecName: Full=Ribose-phosphate pyrophosphokinase; Short=RPPK; AltName: Full=5-phospho-D-ribosyl alpha-1-diphosphate synthase; AltName: Full=Phosphoribosyl diphosphate synthase; AltName: Full=Phosphoribosyl pyrophosphate synthase; Short=P-Rib-PP synthase; Short=PRPP synthase; Short=PRPPase [Oceanobacillus iheyensis HTE831]BAC12015.1 ribose-phosphate pyrophosphokinase (PRPP synthetase) [Oceanobacillus iheyensis HTE831]